MKISMLIYDVILTSTFLHLHALASTLSTAMTTSPATDSHIATNPFPSSCVVYPYSDSGVCKEFLSHRYVFVRSKPIEGYLRSTEFNLVEVFHRIKTLVGMIRQSQIPLQTVKSLVSYYRVFFPGVSVPSDNILQRISDQITSVSDQCLYEMRELHCRTYFPLCVRETYKYVQFVIHQRPCREMCLHVINVTCSNVADVLAILREMKLIDSLDCSWFLPYQPGLDRCYWLPESPAPTQALQTAPDLFTEAKADVIDPTVLPTKQESPRATAISQPDLITAVIKDFSSCPFYQDVLPDGVCKEHLRGIRVAQSAELARINNKALSIFYSQSVPIMLEIFGTTSRALQDMSHVMLGDCANQSEIGSLMESITLPSRSEASRCLNVSMRYGCEIYHQICLLDTATNSIMSSYPCKESCLEFEELCAGSLRVMNAINRVKELCPRLNDVNDLMFHVPQCTNFNSKDESKIEACQMIPMKAMESEQRVVRSCLDGIGLHYRGTVNTTASGRACSLWQSMPFFDPFVYPSLADAMNFCRNPQGYRDRPWCYVDMVARDWEYCNITLCDQEDEILQEQQLLSSTSKLWFTVGGGMLLIAMFSFIAACLVSRWRISDKKTKLESPEPTSDIPVDYETAIDVVGITGIMRKTSCSQPDAGSVAAMTPAEKHLLQYRKDATRGEEIRDFASLHLASSYKSHAASKHTDPVEVSFTVSRAGRYKMSPED